VEVFEQTSDKPYTRHTYKLHQTNGSPIVCDDYMVLRDLWMHRRGEGLSHIEVLDVKKTKKKSGGFGG
jgi:hypothetical protein